MKSKFFLSLILIVSILPFSYPDIVFGWGNNITHFNITNDAIDYLTGTDNKYSIYNNYSNFNITTDTQLTFIDEGSVKEDYGCSVLHVYPNIPVWFTCDEDSEPSWSLDDYGTQQDAQVQTLSFGNHGYNPITGKIWDSGKGWLGDVTGKNNASIYCQDIWKNIKKEKNRYFHLGRYCHLLEDMTSPAHANAADHSEFGDDAEAYCEYYFNNYSIQIDDICLPTTDGLNATAGLPHPDLNNVDSPENFIRNVAWNTYYMTTYYGGELDDENPQDNSELLRMAPSLRYDDGGWDFDYWVIDEIGKHYNGWVGTDVWWECDADDGYYYLENIDGDPNGTSNASLGISANFFTPAVFKANPFRRVLPTDEFNSNDILKPNSPNPKSLLNIYKDELPPFAGKWVAGFLKFANDPIPKALEYLKSRQNQTTGSWANDAYSGTAGTTAMATQAFLQAGYIESDPVVSKGINHLLTQVRADGSIHSGSSYSVYETALAILALKATGNPAYHDEIANAAQFLKNAQNRNTLSNNYGGWSYSPSSSSADLSNSQFAILALQAAGENTLLVNLAFQTFLAKCQNANGGFGYTPGGTPFGSMTAAGIWGLRLCGADILDQRVVAAVNWLGNNENLSFDDNPSGQYGNRKAYYQLSFAKAMSLCFLSPEIKGAWFTDWNDKLRQRITQEQHTEGYLQDWHGAIIDTCFSVLALQVDQPPPALFWLAVVLESPANLIVYDPEGRIYSKDQCTIPGAQFEVDAEGHQIVKLPEVDSGQYRFILHGTDDGTCHVKTIVYREEVEYATETMEVPISKHEVLYLDCLVGSFFGALSTLIDDPLPPTDPDTGDPLVYDFDCDGDIDVVDIMQVACRWSFASGDPEYDAFYDFSDNGEIDVIDIMAVASNWTGIR